MATVVDLSECTTRQSEEYTARMLNRRALNWWNDVKTLMKSEFIQAGKVDDGAGVDEF